MMQARNAALQRQQQNALAGAQAAGGGGYAAQNAADAQTQRLQAGADVQMQQQNATSGLANQQSQNEVTQQQQIAQWMQQQQWTATDESQLSQAQNGLAQIQADPSINQDPQAMQAAGAQYMPYIQQAQQRKQYWLTRMQGQQQQQQAEQTMHLHAQNVAMQAQSGQAAGSMIQTPIRNPDTGELMAMHVKTMKGDGTWDSTHYPVQKDDSAKLELAQIKAASTRQAHQQDVEIRAQETEAKHADRDSDRWDEAHMKITKMIEDQSHQMVDDGSGEDKKKLAYPNLAANPRVDGRTVKEWQHDDQMNKLGYGPDKDAYLKKQADIRAARAQKTTTPTGAAVKPAGGDERQPPAAGGATNPPTEPPKKKDEPTAKPTPFAMYRYPGDDGKDMTDEQREARGTMLDMFDQLDQSRVAFTDPELAKRAHDEAHAFAQIWETYGNVKAMSPEVKARLVNHVLSFGKTMIEVKNKINSGALNNPRVKFQRDWSE